MKDTFMLPNHLYIKFTHGRTERYVYSDAERDRVLKDIEGESYKINRYKGLGEMNAEQLWETTMNPDNRVLLRVLENTESTSTDDTFSLLMGEKVEPRREFIEENAKYVSNIDV